MLHLFFLIRKKKENTQPLFKCKEKKKDRTDKTGTRQKKKEFLLLFSFALSGVGVRTCHRLLCPFFVLFFLVFSSLYLLSCSLAPSALYLGDQIGPPVSSARMDPLCMDVHPFVGRHPCDPHKQITGRTRMFGRRVRLIERPTARKRSRPKETPTVTRYTRARALLSLAFGLTNVAPLFFFFF